MEKRQESQQKDPFNVGQQLLEGEVLCPLLGFLLLNSLVMFFSDTWLILPVVICLSQKLSHASLSISYIQRDCRRLIISVIVYTTGRIAIWITVVILELIHAEILSFAGKVALLVTNANLACQFFGDS